jgi:DNA helicase-2/ATP-dependent DNA helicase PcrA
MALPGEILSVTFTNKAANEMKNRVGNLIGDMVTGLKWLGTFHSIGAQILRQYPEKVGLKNGFIILDTDDQLRLLKQIIRDENIDDKKWSAKGLLSLIDKWKNKGLSPSQVTSDDGDYFANGKGRVLYKKYQEQLKFFNAADFGDLILECIRLFNENQDILESFQNRFKYMLVDEYQDTNTSQYTLLKLLSGKWKNICCVGDDDQSIYSWRGAEVTNILKFEKDFADSRIIRLEQNYRSTGNILAAASKLIEANESRFGKTLWTSSNGGEKVSVTSTWDGEEEARIITDEIEQQSLNKKNLDEVAILVRASFQMREFEDRFVSIGLPYKVIGGPRFYERKEIRDANAYFRLAIHPNDSLALERVLNVPKRGIGETTLKKIKQYAKNNNIPTIDAIRDLIKTSEIKPKTKISLKHFVELTERWNDLIKERSHFEIAEIILEDSGYLEMLRNDDTLTAAGRLDNIKELFRSIEPFESLSAYLEHISLVMEIDKNPEGNKVSLMTLHAAKGLEFDYVYLPGWEEGVFPNQRSLDEGGIKSLEEERRLAYVGITRAKVKSSIFYAANRKMHNQWLSSIASRFVSELPDENVEVNLSHFSGNKGNFTDIKEDIFDQSDYSTPGWERAKIQSSNKKILVEDVTDISLDNNSKFSSGSIVFHKKFGQGKVESIDGKKLTINFGSNGTRKVMENFVDTVS